MAWNGKTERTVLCMCDRPGQHMACGELATEISRGSEACPLQFSPVSWPVRGPSRRKPTHQRLSFSYSVAGCVLDRRTFTSQGAQRPGRPRTQYLRLWTPVLSSLPLSPLGTSSRGWKQVGCNYLTYVSWQGDTFVFSENPEKRAMVQTREVVHKVKAVEAKAWSQACYEVVTG